MEEAEKKYFHAVSILEQATDLKKHENVDIVFANGSEALPSIVLASISGFIKEYLIEISCSYDDPCVIIPNLLKEDFMTFKRYLTSRVDGSYHIKKSEVASLSKVFQQFCVECDEMFEDLNLTEENQKTPNIRKSFMPQTKRVPSILSKSSQASTSSDFLEDDSLHLEEEEEYYDDDVDDTNEPIPEQISGDPLSCSYCSKKYSHTKARNKHMINEHLELCKRDGLCHPCSACPALFVSMAGREKHVKRMHPSPTDKLPDTSGFRCPFCEEKNVFQKIKDLHSHIKTHHPAKDKSCVACGQDHSAKDELEKHIQSHKMGVPGSLPLYFCEHCGKVFIREYGLNVHKRNSHSTVENSLSCQYCGKDFKNAKFLKYHEAKHQNGFEDSGQHVCPHCGKEFRHSSRLDRHVKNTHQKVKSHECTECGKRFVDSTRLKEHKWIHVGHKPYKCSYCDQTFRQKNHVKHHEAKIHEMKKQHQCTQCSKSFCFGYELKSHIKTSHGAKSRNDNDMLVQLQCELCDQLFPTLPILKAHWRTHASQENISQIALSLEDRPQPGQQIFLEVEGNEQSYIIEYE